jgi:hydrogenase nickel incorporation protein HypA/HybF
MVHIFLIISQYIRPPLHGLYWFSRGFSLHELSIAQSVIDTVLREMAARQLAPASTIVLRIGPLSGVMADAVQFGFDSLRQGTPLEKTLLVIEETTITGECQSCHQTVQLRDLQFLCPACGSQDLHLSGGDELDIARFTVES